MSRAKSLGRAAHRATLEDLAKEFDCSTRAAKSLLRSLRVPLFLVGSKSYFNYNEFLKAFQAVSRIGQPDFWAPGSKFRRNYPSKRTDHWHPHVRELDLEYFAKNVRTFAEELAMNRQIFGARTTPAQLDEHRKAAYRMVASILQLRVADVQAYFEDEAHEMVEKALDNPDLEYTRTTKLSPEKLRRGAGKDPKPVKG